MAYICVGKVENGFCAGKRYVRFFMGKVYEIIGDGDDYYLVIQDNQKVKIRGFIINTDLVVVVSEEQLDEKDWIICKSLEELKRGD